MIIAVDAVGGDKYPENPVKGAIQATEENKALSVILVGPESLVQKELANHTYDENRILVEDAPQIIEMDESPAQAVKSKQKSSIAVGLKLHKEGAANAFVSAGNTGALLAASTLLLGKLEGVMRPTIAATYPTIKGFRLLLDVGANLEVRPEMLYQFALMGSIYTEQVMGIENPRLGLLNVGEEEEKGTEEIRESFDLLSELPNFIGNIEGRDILFGKADVYLCDGFVGNLILKFGESIPNALRELINPAIKQLDLDEVQAKTVGKVLETAVGTFNYERVGGVPFLGVNGVSMVGHGGSTPLAVKNMIFNAVKCVENNINELIIASLNE
ncbi:MAG: phosphate acyltransferase PlsX [Balneolaceae bacterium]|nr:phosphate acyltransferase PlsX [Balneolaceae bacterium]